MSDGVHTLTFKGKDTLVKAENSELKRATVCLLSTAATKQIRRGGHRMLEPKEKLDPKATV